MSGDAANTSVAAIIVNWNGAADTCRCLTSLASLGLRAYVVDNGSSDDSVAVIRASFPEATVIEAWENRGYAGGFNLGRARALADGAAFIWLLNNDVQVEPETLPELLAVQARLGMGIYAPKIFYSNRPEVLWFAGGLLEPNLKSHHRGQGEVDHGQYDHLTPTPWATGCALFLSRADAVRIGPMDESYFLYLEDVDWCLRARGLGIPTYFVPSARIRHGVSRSVGRLDPRAARYYAWRNYYLLVARHGTPRQQASAGADLAARFVKIALRSAYFPAHRTSPLYQARTRALIDVIRGRTGVAPW